MDDKLEQLTDPHAGKTRIETPHGCGWTADGVEVSLDDGRVIALLAAPTPAAPPSVTRRQLRRWLVKQGISLDAIRADLALLPEPQRSLALIDFDDALVYEIDNPLVTMLAEKFQMDLPAAFTAAAQE